MPYTLIVPELAVEEKLTVTDGVPCPEVRVAPGEMLQK